MAIKSIDVLHLAIPFDSGGPQFAFRPSLSKRPWTKNEVIYVRVTTTDGRVGWGEGFGNMAAGGTAAILANVVAPFFIGQDEANHEALTEEARKAFMIFGRSGPMIYAISAVDIALWDLAAQAADQPLWAYLGGSAEPIECYGSLMRYRGDLEAIERNTRRAVDVGYRFVKIHETELEPIRTAVRATDGKAEIMIDVNCAYTPEGAVEMAQALPKEGVYWFEEPVWPSDDHNAIRKVRDQGVPIALGENAASTGELVSLIETETADFIQPSIIKLGGVSEMRRLFAQVPHDRICPHAFYSGPGFVASAHVMSTMTMPAYLETALIEYPKLIQDQFAPFAGNMFNLLDRPGLGYRMDMDDIAEFVVSHVHVDGSA